MEIFTIKSESFFTKTQYYILLLIVFLMPFSRKAIPPLTIAFTFFWLLEGNLKEKLTVVFIKHISILLISFYLLHLVGMLWTLNYSAGWFDMEVKFSLFIFPILIFGSATFFKEKFNSILWCFVLANFVSSLICFIYVFYRTFKFNASVMDFIYEDFSLFLHPTYGAMYVLFSTSVIIHFLMNKENSFRSQKISLQVVKWILVFVITFFILTIYFYSSRAGLLSAVAIFFISIFYLIFKRQLNILIKIFIAICFCGVVFLFIQCNPRIEIFNNFLHSSKELNYQTRENIQVRYIINLETIKLIKHHLGTGVGTGDVKDVLMQQYKTKHFNIALEKNLNVHNQYLETTLCLGIIGGVFLLLILLMTLILGSKHGNILTIFFSVIIIINFLFESMLNVQFGVVFYSFFNSLLLLHTVKD